MATRRERAAAAAERLKALADPTRLLLILAAAEKPRSVKALAKKVRADPASASRHLKALKAAGFARVRVGEDGRSKIYSLSEKAREGGLDLLGLGIVFPEAGP